MPDPLIEDLSSWPTMTRAELLSRGTKLIYELASLKDELGMVRADEKRTWMQFYKTLPQHDPTASDAACRRYADWNTTTLTSTRYELEGRIAMLEEARHFLYWNLSQLPPKKG